MSTYVIPLGTNNDWRNTEAVGFDRSVRYAYLSVVTKEIGVEDRALWDRLFDVYEGVYDVLRAYTEVLDGRGVSTSQLNLHRIVEAFGWVQAAQVIGFLN